MGIFDSIKKGLGLSSLEVNLQVQPQTLHISGQVEGQLQIVAQKPVNIFTVELDLQHGFRDEMGYRHIETVDGTVLAERIAMQPNERSSWPFYFPVPATAAPTMRGFDWELQARVRTESAGQVKKELTLQVRASPVTATILQIMQQQFGWQLRDSGAEEDGIWYEFAPGPQIRGHFEQLTLSFEEEQDELELWVQLIHFRPGVVERFDRQFDEHDGSITLEIDKRQYMAGPQIDQQGLLSRLQPLFALQ